MNDVFSRIGCGFLLAAILLGSAVAAKAQGDMIGGVGITLFDDADFRGETITFRENVPDLANRGAGDRARSLRVGPGEQWEVCENAYYRGRCIVVSGEERDLRRNGWDNRISSLRRVGGTPPTTGDGYVVLFTGRNYTGSPTNYNSSDSIIQKNARSVTVGQGTWQLCDGIRFTGRCITLTQSVPDLRSYSIGGTIRSLRPAGFIPPGPIPLPVAGYIVLFDRTNYRGDPTNYRRSQSNIVKRTRSVTIGSGVWEICDGRNFTGRCETLNQSVPNLRSYDIGDTIRSVRQVERDPR